MNQKPRAHYNRFMITYNRVERRSSTSTITDKRPIHRQPCTVVGPQLAGVMREASTHRGMLDIEH